MKMPFALVALLLSALLPDSSVAQTSSAADKQFAAIHEKEWSWRKTQFSGLDDDKEKPARVDSLPQIDARTQRQRLDVWDGVLRE
ncbi:MAG: DUF885 domain-containing protein, partial [Dokdonella sp.]